MTFFGFPDGSFLVHPQETSHELRVLITKVEKESIEYADESFIREFFKAGKEAQKIYTKCVEVIEAGVDPQSSPLTKKVTIVLDNFEKQAKTLVGLLKNLN